MRISTTIIPKFFPVLKTGAFSLVATLMLAPSALAQSQYPHQGSFQVIAGANTQLNNSNPATTAGSANQIVVAGRFGRSIGRAAARAAVGAAIGSRSRDDDDDADGESSDNSNASRNRPRARSVTTTPARTTTTPAAPTTATPAAPGSSASTVVASRPREGDIYDQWSQKKLKNGLSPSSKPHALALEHPDDFVVVCQAGCRKEEAQIVYIEARSARGPVYKTVEHNTQTEVDYVACVGGCYSGAVGRPLYHADLTATQATGGSWMTTTTPTPATTTPVTPGPKAAAPAPATAPSASATGPTQANDRWYERINGSNENTAGNSVN